MNQIHLTEQELNALCTGQCTEQEKLRWLSHCASCSECSQMFAERMSESVPLQAPVHLKGEILKKSKKLALSKNIQLLTYSLKVGAAAAVLLLFIGISKPESGVDFTAGSPGLTEVTQRMNQTTQIISSSITDFTNRLVTGKEGYRNDKEKE